METFSLQGNLRSFRLADILSLFAATRKSGALSLASTPKAAVIFFDAGAVAYATSNQEQFRLGQLLVRMKKITPAQLDQLDAAMRGQSDSVGRVAIRQKLVSDEELRDCLKIQVSEIIYDCFVWLDGEFSFDEEAQIPVNAVTIAIDLPNLIMEGIRRIDEWERCHLLLPDPRQIFRVVSNPNTEDKITLTVDEWKILFLINGQRSLEDICHDSGESPLQVYRVVYGLLANKLIEPIGSIAAPPPSTVLVPRRPPVEETESLKTEYQQIEAPSEPASTTVRQYPPAITPSPAVNEDATFYMTPELQDDRSLLVSPEARLSFRDVVKTTVGRLTLRGSPDTNVNWPLTEQEYRIGRLRSNDIQLFDLSVSGAHARIYRSRDGYMIEDLKSRNGTFINGTRIQTTLLRDGDLVRFGATEVVYDEL